MDRIIKPSLLIAYPEQQYHELRSSSSLNDVFGPDSNEYDQVTAGDHVDKIFNGGIRDIDRLDKLHIAHQDYAANSSIREIEVPSEEVKTFVRGLAETAMKWMRMPVGYIDIDETVKGATQTERAAFEIEEKSIVAESTLVQLVIAKAEKPVNDVRAERFQNIVNKLNSMPSNVFRVALVHTPEFARSLEPVSSYVDPQSVAVQTPQATQDASIPL